MLLTNSKLILLTTQQGIKLREKLLGQETLTLFRKPADWEDGGPVSWRTVLTNLEFRLLLYQKGERWLVGGNFLVWESFVLAAIHIGPVMMFL